MSRTLVRLVIAGALLVVAMMLVAPGPEQPSPRTWESLLEPLGVGRPVARGYLLGAPHRGEEHDLVLTARSPDGGASIELHVLDRGRWSGIRETPSFGVAYEAPRSAGPIEDSQAITEALAQALGANDPGGLGPVDTIPLRSEEGSPPISRALDRLSGARGLAVGACLAGFTWALAATSGGAWSASIWLLFLGLLLRAPSLGIPFAHDQDVQRLFTGHLPLTDILLARGPEYRHPPFYFVILHVAQLFGQSESVVRAPAVVFGSLVGPAIVWGARVLGRRVDVAALAGLLATVSLPLIARSREVSSFPFFALLVLISSVSLVKHTERPSRGWTATVAVSQALALWTYYLAPFVLAGTALLVLGLRRLPKATARAMGIGVAAGAPALALGVVAFLQDRGARQAASEHPLLAWGEHGTAEMARALADVALTALGPALLVVLGLLVVRAASRRDIAALVPAAGLVVSFIAIAALAPVARMHAYYLEAVLPLGVLAVALEAGTWCSGRPWLAPAALGLIAAATAIPALSSGRAAYLPDADAFMPSFAEIILDAPEVRVLTVAHYDGHLLAYYLARRAGVPMDWGRMHGEGEAGDGGFRLAGVDKVLQPLAMSHALADDPDAAAVERLESALQREPVLVVERDRFRLRLLSQRLGGCTLLAEAGTGRLFRCAERRSPTTPASPGAAAAGVRGAAPPQSPRPRRRGGPARRDELDARFRQPIR